VGVFCGIFRAESVNWRVVMGTQIAFCILLVQHISDNEFRRLGYLAKVEEEVKLVWSITDPSTLIFSSADEVGPYKDDIKRIINNLQRIFVGKITMNMFGTGIPDF